MRRHRFVLAAIAALSPLVVQAQTSSDWAPDMSEVHGTVGLRMWQVDWSSWFGADRYLHADKETTATPVASLRYKNFLLSGSYMVKKEFTFPLTSNREFERREWDVNFGYFIVPGLAATIGYKDVKYDTAQPYRWHAKGLTVGLSGSAPVHPTTSLYGSFAYGRPKITDFAGGAAYAFNGARSTYLLTEMGLAFPLGAVDQSMTGFVVTAGYRYQRIGAKVNTGNFSAPELYETAQGPVISISYSR